MSDTVHFTERELDCLRMLARGVTQKAIADGLRIDVRSVRRILRECRAKLGAQTDMQAVYLATREGLI